MRKLIIGMALAAVCAQSTSVFGASLKKLTFSATDPGALVLIEESPGMHGGIVTFAKVNLDKMTREDSYGVSKRTDGRLRTKNPYLATQGEGLMIPKDMSRFSAAKLPAGDYALVGFDYSMLTYNSYGCLPDGAPVYHFKPGIANLISAEMLPSGGTANTFFRFRASRSGSGSDITDAQSILDEYDNLKSPVSYAKFVGFVKFRAKNGKTSGCERGVAIASFTETK